jgi:hypothetical protein
MTTARCARNTPAAAMGSDFIIAEDAVDSARRKLWNSPPGSPPGTPARMRSTWRCQRVPAAVPPAAQSSLPASVGVVPGQPVRCGAVLPDGVPDGLRHRLAAPAGREACQVSSQNIPCPP